jgi:hypothetical protein
MPIQFLNTNGRGGFTLKNNSGVGRLSMNTYPVDADANAFFARVTAAGGSLSQTEKVAVTQLAIDLKAINIWNSTIAIYPFVGASAAACSQNLISSLHTGVFTGGWTYARTGVTSDGTTGFMDTNINGQNGAYSMDLYIDNNHTGVYVRTNTLGGSDTGVRGPIDSPPHYYYNITAIDTNGNATWKNGNIAISGSVSNSSGFTLGSATSLTSNTLYKNGSNIATTSATQTDTVPTSFSKPYLGGVHWYVYNNPIEFTTREQAYASFGYGLTSTQAANYYNVVQSFQTALSRQV